MDSRREHLIAIGVIVPAEEVTQPKLVVPLVALPTRRGSGDVFGGDKWMNDCGRKRAHQTLASAMAHALKIVPRAKCRLAIYVCRWCDWFHVGKRRT